MDTMQKDVKNMRTIAVIDEKDYEAHWPRKVRPSVKAIIFRDGKLAMMKGEKLGHYDFPGGGIDADETHETALARELLEEAGLHLLPESVATYGKTLAARAGKKGGDYIFEQEIYYYTCDVDPEKLSAPKPECYEIDLGHKLVYATLDEAIAANEKVVNHPDLPWVRHENALLYELKKIHESPAVLIPEEKITTRVKELAAEISRDYAGKKLTLIGTLKGAVIFFSDLAREITVPIEMEFVKISSYGMGTESTGQVRLDAPERLELADRHIILVEDIVDMGYTASWLREFIESQHPASFALCSLLDKPDRRKVPVTIEYLGFSIPDEFVVGYGLDYAQQYRNLPYVGKIEVE